MDVLQSLFYNIDYLDYDAVAAKSTLNSHEDFFKMLMRKNKKELVATLINYSYNCNNDKSTGTALEAAIAQVMGSLVDRKKKHGCDSFYENGNTLEIKPENVYYPSWDGNEYIPTTSNKLNMLGKYNDFTWHGIIRYISGTETNSSDSAKYRSEINDFINKYYLDEDYKVFMRVACNMFGKVAEQVRAENKWWDFIADKMDKNLTKKQIPKEWQRIVDKVQITRGLIKPTKWNKYQVSGGSVGGKLVYVARVDFPVVYEKLFDKLLDFFPPDLMFKSTKSRCQIDFTYTALNSSNIHRVKWIYVDPELYRYKKCFSKGLWDIIVFCNPHLQRIKPKESDLNSFERLFSYDRKEDYRVHHTANQTKAAQ